MMSSRAVHGAAPPAAAVSSRGRGGRGSGGYRHQNYPHSHPQTMDPAQYVPPPFDYDQYRFHLPPPNPGHAPASATASALAPANPLPSTNNTSSKKKSRKRKHPEYTPPKDNSSSTNNSTKREYPGYTREEDKIITNAVLRYIMKEGGNGMPFKAWNNLASKKFGGRRKGKQLYARWHNCLNPEINHLPFGWDDDVRLQEGYEALGNRWKKISEEYFDGKRSGNQLKNRYGTDVYKELAAAGFPELVYDNMPHASATSGLTDSGGEEDEGSLSEQESDDDMSGSSEYDLGHSSTVPVAARGQYPHPIEAPPPPPVGAMPIYHPYYQHAAQANGYYPPPWPMHQQQQLQPSKSIRQGGRIKKQYRSTKTFTRLQDTIIEDAVAAAIASGNNKPNWSKLAREKFPGYIGSSLQSRWECKLNPALVHLYSNKDGDLGPGRRLREIRKRYLGKRNVKHIEVAQQGFSNEAYAKLYKSQFASSVSRSREFLQQKHSPGLDKTANEEKINECGDLSEASSKERKEEESLLEDGVADTDNKKEVKDLSEKVLERDTISLPEVGVRTSTKHGNEEHGRPEARRFATRGRFFASPAHHSQNYSAPPMHHGWLFPTLLPHHAAHFYPSYGPHHYPSPIQQQRKQSESDNTNKKVEFTLKEDTMIIKAIESSHDRYFARWDILAQEKFLGKTGKQIRDRWFNELYPTCNLLPFSKDEDVCLMLAYKCYGPNWRKIKGEYFKDTRWGHQLKERFCSWQYKKLSSQKFSEEAYANLEHDIAVGTMFKENNQKKKKRILKGGDEGGKDDDENEAPPDNIVDDDNTMSRENVNDEACSSENKGEDGGSSDFCSTTREEEGNKVEGSPELTDKKTTNNITPAKTIILTVLPGNLGLLLKTNPREGAKIIAIYPDSSLLKQVDIGDRIVSISGRPVTCIADLQVGKTLTRKIVIVQDGIHAPS